MKRPRIPIAALLLLCLALLSPGFAVAKASPGAHVGVAHSEGVQTMEKLTSVRVTHEVASTRHDMTGQHNVILADERVVSFTSQPTYVRGELPREIADNPYLLREPATEADLSRRPGPVLEFSFEVPAEVSALKYQEVLKLAGALGLDTSGKKADLVARIEALRDAKPAGGENPPDTGASTATT